MDVRRFLHPLPLLLLTIFVLVAVGDLVQKIVEGPPPPLEVGGSTPPLFAAREPVIDLRPGRAPVAIEMGPTPKLQPPQWSEPQRGGVWVFGPSAEFEISFAEGGHRALVLESRPVGGEREIGHLRLTVNEHDCGSIELAPGWKRYRFVLPQGAVRAGANRVALRFPDLKAQKSRRALLLRRIGWFLDPEVTSGALDRKSPVAVDLGEGRLEFRQSGTLEIPIILETRTDALQMRYRFGSPRDRAEVVVEQQQTSDSEGGDRLHSGLVAEVRRTGRLRIPVHGRRGSFVLRIRTELRNPESSLKISSLRLIEEGDPLS